MTPRRASLPRRLPAPPWTGLPGGLALALVLVWSAAIAATAAAGPAGETSGVSPSDGDGRAMYRIGPGRARSFEPLQRLGVDVAGTTGGDLDVILTPEELERVRALGYEPVPIDITPRGLHGASMSPLLNPDLGAYHTVAEAAAEMAAYAGFYPNLARLDTLGFSVEGRPLIAVKISDNAGADEPEPEALVAGCHHARELMSVEVPLYLMRRLLDGYGVDPVLTTLVDTREIWIIPIVNPDGHVHVEQNSSGQSSGWWRKNRRPNGDGSVGVDPNRNYGYFWGYDDIGSSPTPASDVYRGTGPFSEPETGAIRDFMAAHAFTVSASFHSYGELILFPWGYDQLNTPDHAVFRALGDSMALQNGYLAGNPKSGAIYLTNGDMDDWCYGESALKPKLFGFTFELNTAGQGGFAPHASQIEPTCELNWGPLLTLLRFADGPRRAIGPARPSAPTFVQSSTELTLHWSSPPDPENPPVRHDLRRIDAFQQGIDGAESGTAAWDTTLFGINGARSASGSQSFYSGTGDNRVSLLVGKTGIDVAPGDSLVMWAFWDLESDYDYWYAEASTDAGFTWIPLAGNWSSPFDPFGFNEGNGVTGTSGGIFRRAAFSLAPFVGAEPRIRFRCVTDISGNGEGVYLDDVDPAATESGITITDTQSAASVHAIEPPPSALAWYQVRAVDAQSQLGYWGPRGRYDPLVTGVEGPAAPARVDRLFPNAPNPFHPRTEIRFTLGVGRPGPYRLEVFDAAGRRVALLAEGMDSGKGSSHGVRWDGKNAGGRQAGSGIYLLRLETIRGVASRKIILLR